MQNKQVHGNRTESSFALELSLNAQLIWNPIVKQYNMQIDNPISVNLQML